MLYQEVEADCLAAILVLDMELEPLPEPFRMQSDVALTVNFEEYVKFIGTLPDGTHILHSKSDRLKAAVVANDESALLKSFYVDMARAVGKELFYAERYGLGATVIRHGFYGQYPNKDIPSYGASEEILRTILQERGFQLPTTISAQNARHWKYACKLLYDASKDPTRWVEKM